jgi:hypothetical protein
VCTFAPDGALLKLLRQHTRRCQLHPHRLALYCTLKPNYIDCVGCMRPTSAADAPARLRSACHAKQLPRIRYTYGLSQSTGVEVCHSCRLVQPRSHLRNVPANSLLLRHWPTPVHMPTATYGSLIKRPAEHCALQHSNATRECVHQRCKRCCGLLHCSTAVEDPVSAIRLNPCGP